MNLTPPASTFKMTAHFKTQGTVMNKEFVFSIKQFCAAHGLSRTLFYTLLKQNKAPRLMYVGRRRMISHDAAAEWRKNMERK